MPFLQDRRATSPASLASQGVSTGGASGGSSYNPVYSTIAKNLAAWDGTHTELDDLLDATANTNTCWMTGCHPDAALIIYRDNGDADLYVAARGKNSGGNINQTRVQITGLSSLGQGTMKTVGPGQTPYIVLFNSSHMLVLKYDAGDEEIDVLEDDATATIFSSQDGATTIYGDENCACVWLDDDVLMTVTYEGVELRITTIRLSSGGVTVLDYATQGSTLGTVCDYNPTHCFYDEDTGNFTACRFDNLNIASNDFCATQFTVSTDFNTITIDASSTVIIGARLTYALHGTYRPYKLTSLAEGVYGVTYEADANNDYFQEVVVYDPATPSATLVDGSTGYLSNSGDPLGTDAKITHNPFYTQRYGTYANTSESQCHLGEKYGDLVIDFNDTNTSNPFMQVVRSGSWDIIGGVDDSAKDLVTNSFDEHVVACFTTDLSKLVVSGRIGAGSSMETRVFEFSESVEALPDLYKVIL